jgi:hypothetical protein
MDSRVINTESNDKNLNIPPTTLPPPTTSSLLQPPTIPRSQLRSEEGEMEEEPHPKRTSQTEQSSQSNYEDLDIHLPIRHKTTGLFGFTFLGGLTVLGIGGLVMIGSYYLRHRVW